MSGFQKIVGALLLSGCLFVLLRGGNEAELTTVLTTPAAAPAGAETPSAVLVELFTSQGCSSCPPADRVLQRLVDDSEQGNLNVIALSYHVDYWNRLGWKDPYSQAAFSDRQREYARRLPEHRVYTPHLVIQGQRGLVGSREREVRAAISKASVKGEGTTIGVEVTVAGDKTPERTLHYTLTGRTTDILLQVATVETTLANDVSRGENRGRHLAHTQVVIDLQTHRNPFAEGTLNLNPETLTKLQDGKVVVFVQDIENWDVLGVIEVAL